MELDGIVLLVRSKPKACQSVSAKPGTTHEKGSIEDDLSDQLRSLLVSSGEGSEVR